MSLRVLDVEQRSDEWYKARCGLITASAVSALVTPRTIKTAKNDESRALAATLAAERITGHVEPTFVSADMWRGIDSEDPAREKYAEHYGTEVASCGFMIREESGFTLGYSPDGLVGGAGLIEIKAPRQKGHLLTVVSGAVPEFHMAQIQAGLLVSGREWCDFVSFNGGMNIWVKRVTPDPDWQHAITEAVRAFEQTVEQLVADFRAAVDGFPMTERLPDPFAKVELKL